MVTVQWSFPVVTSPVTTSVNKLLILFIGAAGISFIVANYVTFKKVLVMMLSVEYFLLWNFSKFLKADQKNVPEILKSSSTGVHFSVMFKGLTFH